jgi:hypothetical protein
VTEGRGLDTADLFNLWNWRGATTWQFGGRVQYFSRGGDISVRQRSIRETFNDCGTDSVIGDVDLFQARDF